jgi:hypothetical protein
MRKGPPVHRNPRRLRMRPLGPLALLLAAVVCGAAVAEPPRPEASAERQQKPQDDRTVEEACQPAAQRFKGADEELQKAKAEGAPAKVIERRTKEWERARRDHCKCAGETYTKSAKPLPEDLESLCNPKPGQPQPGDGGATATPGANPAPTPPPAEGDLCAAEASGYEKAWMRYSENVRSKPLQQQVQAAKGKLCGCLSKHYAYEGVLPQALRAFCEDRAIFTPPYFPSRGETPRTGAP